MSRLAWVMAVASVLLAACADTKVSTKNSRWDAYYADVNAPRAHVVVVPPDGTTVPMSKLIADYVAQGLRELKISAVVGPGKVGQGRHFILTGVAEEVADPRARHKRVMRWVLSDAGGRVISTHTHAIDGTQAEWDYGSARVLEAIGLNASAPVARLVLAETKARTPIDPLQSGLLVEDVQGVSPGDGRLIAQEVKNALRTSDIMVTGDPRQAVYRLTGLVESTPAEGGGKDVRITWKVSTLDGQEVGQAVQENRLDERQLQGGWADMAPRVGAAAAVGVEHIFGVRSGPAPGDPKRARGEPPAIVLPGVPGRAPPPPQ